MADSQRTTVYFSPKLYRALKVKAATTDRGLSELVNEAVQLALREDAIDEEAFRRRSKEPARGFAEVLRDLKRARLL
ncbi:MAG: CopG family transcriptional regulator [Candidatus Acidiferrales bacterium]